MQKETCKEINPQTGAKCGLPEDHEKDSVFRVHGNGTQTRTWITRNEVKDKTLTE